MSREYRGLVLEGKALTKRMKARQDRQWAMIANRQRDGSSSRGLSRRTLQHFQSGRTSFAMEAVHPATSKRGKAKAKRTVAMLDRVLPYLERRASRAHNVEW